VRKILFPHFLCALALVVSSCSGGTSSGASGSDDVAAVVNGTKILLKDVDRVIAQQSRDQENQPSQLEQAAMRLQALETLIGQEVLFQRAQQDNIAPTDDEIKQYIQRYKQDNGFTEEAFANELKRTNQTEEQFRDFVRKQLAIQKLYEKSDAQLKVQDREVAEVYNINPKRFSIQPGIAISDIIIDPRENGMKFDAQGDAAAEQRIREIHTRLKNGSDFATNARQFSEHQSAMQSGDLGFLPQSGFAKLPEMMGLPSQLGDRLMSMKEGDITEPIKDSANRWHIFKLTAKQTETRDRTLDDQSVRKEISDAILSQRKQIVAAALQAKARDEAEIENHLAGKMLDNPNSFGVLRPVPAATSGSASQEASPSASPVPAPKE
jgi:parvulin-like peptidyl-prolyl isomerase